MKRNKDRHQLAHSSSFRYHHRPSSPTYLVEDGDSSSEHGGGHMTPFACPLEVNTSPLPMSPAFLKYPRDRSNSSCSHYRGSPYDLSIYSPDANSNPLRRNSDPMARNTDRGVSSPPLPMDMEEEYDQPLDMSKKSRVLSTSSSSSSPPSESHHQQSDNHQLHHNHRHPSLHHHHHGSTSSSSSSSTSSRSNTCSPESIYKGNQFHSNNKNFVGSRQNSIFHNQPHHLYQQSPSPSTINSPIDNTTNHINSHNDNPHLQPRPSVITCASTLFGPRRSASSSSTSSNYQSICSNNNMGKDESTLYSSHHNQHLHHHQINSCLTSSDKTLNTGSPRPSSLASTSSSSSLSSFSSSSSCSSSFRHHQSTMKSQTLRPETANDASSFNRHGKKKLEEPKKLVIHGEDSDSGIDEHFRRSLGDHYRNYTNVSMSVDDHFAKALGDTWLKLKRESQNGSKGSSYKKPNASTIPS